MMVISRPVESTKCALRIQRKQRSPLVAPRARSGGGFGVRIAFITSRWEALPCPLVMACHPESGSPALPSSARSRYTGAARLLGDTNAPWRKTVTFWGRALLHASTPAGLLSRTALLFPFIRSPAWLARHPRSRAVRTSRRGRDKTGSGRT